MALISVREIPRRKSLREYADSHPAFENVSAAKADVAERIKIAEINNVFIASPDAC
jgi:hypothetical protein